MVRYTSSQQLRLFETPFERELNPKNRWVVLSDLIPWDKLASQYYRSLSQDQGRPGVDARVVIGALIIKHRMSLSDQETIELIAENPYMQFFLGLERFSEEPVFDPSLFVTIRERLGIEVVSQWNRELTLLGTKPEEGAKKSKKALKDEPDQDDDSGSDSDGSSDNRGTLVLDATVVEQQIAFPTDVGLVNRARLESERLIDLLWQPHKGKIKPRTYRQVARKDYLRFSKNRKPTKKRIRKAWGKQLGYLRRNLDHLRALMPMGELASIFVRKRDQEIYQTISLIYRQQLYMYQNRTHQCPDRIVSIHQPFVRPVKTGKSANATFFGPKLSVSYQEGFANLDYFRYAAFDEGADLQPQVEDYKKRYGYYPAKLAADKKYATRKNRAWLKEKNIQFMGKPLGRPRKEDPEQKELLKQGRKIRSRIEGKFGETKRNYLLDSIKARKEDTSESWAALAFFSANVFKLLRQFLGPKTPALGQWRSFAGRFVDLCRTILGQNTQPKRPFAMT